MAARVHTRRAGNLYKMVERVDTVRIPPKMLGKPLPEVVNDLTHESFEGKVDKENNLTILCTDVEPVGHGRIVHGDGAVYQRVKFKALVFRPELHEVVQGKVCEILRFGAFVRFGPLDGLLHISQIMDDRIDIDETNNRLVGKDTKRDLRIGDVVRARVVAISINEVNYRESKIGLTMRQPGLGKVEWLEEDRRGGPETTKPRRKKGR
jgi:DNA-directed RNA polymerase subunit E'